MLLPSLRTLPLTARAAARARGPVCDQRAANDLDPAAVGIDPPAHLGSVAADLRVVEVHRRGREDPPAGVGPISQHHCLHQPQPGVREHSAARPGHRRQPGARDGGRTGTIDVAAGEVDPSQLGPGTGARLEHPVDPLRVDRRPAAPAVADDDRAGNVEIAVGRIGVAGVVAGKLVARASVRQHHHVASRMPVGGSDRLAKGAVLVRASPGARVVVAVDPKVLGAGGAGGEAANQQGHGERQRRHPANHRQSQLSLHMPSVSTADPKSRTSRFALRTH